MFLSAYERIQKSIPYCDLLYHPHRATQHIGPLHTLCRGLRLSAFCPNRPRFSSHELHPASFRFFPTVRLHVIFGLPLLPLLSNIQLIAMLQSLIRAYLLAFIITGMSIFYVITVSVLPIHNYIITILLEVLFKSIKKSQVCWKVMGCLKKCLLVCWTCRLLLLSSPLCCFKKKYYAKCEKSNFLSAHSVPSKSISIVPQLTFQ